MCIICELFIAAYSQQIVNLLLQNKTQQLWLIFQEFTQYTIACIGSSSRPFMCAAVDLCCTQQCELIYTQLYTSKLYKCTQVVGASIVIHLKCIDSSIDKLSSCYLDFLGFLCIHLSCLEVNSLLLCLDGPLFPTNTWEISLCTKIQTKANQPNQKLLTNYLWRAIT